MKGIESLAALAALARDEADMSLASMNDEGFIPDDCNCARCVNLCEPGAISEVATATADVGGRGCYLRSRAG